MVSWPDPLCLGVEIKRPYSLRIRAGSGVMSTSSNTARSLTAYAGVGRGRPWLHDSVETAWAALAQMIGRKYPGLLEVGSNERYPKPWAPFVQAGERDKAAYVEAHRLREAGLALEQAMADMKIRWEKDYEGGEQGWQEIERTIESAYSKGA